MNSHNNSEDWRDQALCAQVGPEIFFPSEYTDNNNSHRYDEARIVCGNCPVWRECLIDDMDTSEFIQFENTQIIPDGMRGGLSPRERYLLIQRARRIVNSSTGSNKAKHALTTKAAAEIINRYSQKELQHLTRTRSGSQTLDTTERAG